MPPKIQTNTYLSLGFPFADPSLYGHSDRYLPEVGPGHDLGGQVLNTPASSLRLLCVDRGSRPAGHRPSVLTVRQLSLSAADWPVLCSSLLGLDLGSCCQHS